jgi:hypothetical protein
VLYGGTAIALHLGHRQSVDFDFFGDYAFDPMVLGASVPFLADGLIIQRDRDTLSAIVDRDGPVKVSFFGLPGFRRVASPVEAPDNRLKVASLLDLAGTKVSVVQVRAEAKDYIDIDALMAKGGIPLPAALAAGKFIYGRQFNPQITLKALSFFDDGDLRRLPKAMKSRLAKAAREVDLDSLPTAEELAGQPRDDSVVTT